MMSGTLRYAGIWQETFVECDAERVWDRLYDFVQQVEGSPVEDETSCCLKAQGLLLQLLAEGGIARYVEGDLTDDEVEEELFSRLHLL
jgi:hypothetical protein